MARDRQSWGWIVVGDRVLTVVQVLERVGNQRAVLNLQRQQCCHQDFRVQVYSQMILKGDCVLNLPKCLQHRWICFVHSIFVIQNNLIGFYLSNKTEVSKQGLKQVHVNWMAEMINLHVKDGLSSTQ